MNRTAARGPRQPIPEKKLTKDCLMAAVAFARMTPEPPIRRLTGSRLASPDAQAFASARRNRYTSGARKA